MTQKLEMLKGVLQRVLGVPDHEPEEAYHFKCALEDAIYSTVLDSKTALEQWMAIWILTDSHILTETEIEYQQGVQFVADEWNRILSEDNEGEGL